MEISVAHVGHQIIRRIWILLFLFSDKVFAYLVHRCKYFMLVRYVLVSCFNFCLHLLPSFVVTALPNQERLCIAYDNDRNLIANVSYDDGGGYGDGEMVVAATRDSGIGRALCQVLFLVNETPMSSRKYESVRALADRLIHENLEDGNEVLIRINSCVLSMGFSRTLKQLEDLMINQCRGLGVGFAKADIVNKVTTPDFVFNFSNSIVNAVVNTCANTILYTIRQLFALGNSTEDQAKSLNLAEKFAAELLWLAEEMVDSRCVEEAVHRWASASNLAFLSVMADPHLQAYIIRLSAFLLKQATDLEKKKKRKFMNDFEETKVKMLMEWIPLLCQGCIRTESPLLSMSERKLIEEILSDIIKSLKKNEDKERVLTHWLNHYTSCSSSDWPNLQECFADWYSASRRSMVMSITE